MLVIMTKKKWEDFKKTLYSRIAVVCRERDKYKQMYYDNVENTEKLIKCLNDGSYAQKQYAQQRELNVKLYQENKSLKQQLAVARLKK